MLNFLPVGEQGQSFPTSEDSLGRVVNILDRYTLKVYKRENSRDKLPGYFQSRQNWIKGCKHEGQGNR
jgi:hypothetical protein